MAFFQCDFSSRVLKRSCSMNVILPQAKGEDYHARSASVQKKKHPVLWLLHGLERDHTCWMRYSGIERYAVVHRLAVVMPNVERSFYKNIPKGPQYETFIREELPWVARSFFPLSTKREENFLAGVSMGGYGAFLLALTEPERYAAAVSISGPLDLPACFEYLTDETPLTKEEGLHLFSDVKKVKGSPYDLITLGRKAIKAHKKIPRLYCCCGTEDYLYENNKSFLKQAGRIGLKTTYQEGSGDHTWDFFDQYLGKGMQWIVDKKK